MPLEAAFAMVAGYAMMKKALGPHLDTASNCTVSGN